MAIVPVANQMKVPFIGPWAAGTGITRNGAADNYAFRVSAVDALVDEALVAYAIKTYGAKKPGMILVNNAWGESNQKGLKDALQAANLPTAGIEKYEANDVDMVPQLTRLKEAGADTLFLVGNVGPSAQVVKSLDRMNWSVPVVSHWGPAGGRFDELAGPSAAKVHFIQTFTFAGNTSPKATAVLDALKAKYPAIKSMADVTPRRSASPMPTTPRICSLWRSRRPVRPRGRRFATASTRSAPIRASSKPTIILSPRTGTMRWVRPTTYSRASRTVKSSPSPLSAAMLTSILVSGLGLGSMYGLVALGFHVTYAVSGTVNFAQGSVVTLGAVLAYWLGVTLGWPMPVAILLALLGCALFGLLVEACWCAPS